MDRNRILVVDDDAQMLNILEEILSDKYEVILAEDAYEALEILKSNAMKGEKIQSIVLDWMMPGMSGLDLLKRLKENASFRHIPVIMQTAKNDSQDMLNGIEQGAFQYLTKPYDENVLLSMVDSAVEEFRRLYEE